MNIFNCFQAVGLYTLLPLAIQWTFSNGHDVWGFILAAILFLSYCALSAAVAEVWK